MRYRDPNEELVKTEVSTFRSEVRAGPASKESRKEGATDKSYGEVADAKNLPDNPTEGDLKGDSNRGDSSSSGIKGTAIGDLSAAGQVSGSGSACKGKEGLPLLALQLQFVLPPGTYATMLLRELTKESTEAQFQAQLTSQAKKRHHSQMTAVAGCLSLRPTVISELSFNICRR